MVGEYLTFFQINTRSKFTNEKKKTFFFTSLISQKFSDTAVILAIAVSKRCTQDSPAVNKQRSCTAFLFTYHLAIPETFLSNNTFSVE